MVAVAHSGFGTISAVLPSTNFRLEIVMNSLIFAIIILVLMGTTAACNTVRGVGQDVERAGEKTQDAAESVRRRL
jgi:predicted small secreted protein